MGVDQPGRDEVAVDPYDLVAGFGRHRTDRDDAPVLHRHVAGPRAPRRTTLPSDRGPDPGHRLLDDVAEPHVGDLADLDERRGPLHGGGVLEARVALVEDRLLRVLADGDDQREPELLAVALGELVERLVLVIGEPVEARDGLVDRGARGARRPCRSRLARSG